MNSQSLQLILRLKDDQEVMEFMKSEVFKKPLTKS